jgi:hypothetical protein
MPRLFALLLLLLLMPLPAGAEGETAWPFGGDGRPGARGRDLYGLGVLGAKASDADAAPAPTPGAGGGRTQGAVQRGGDDGPLRLRIEILFPGGPAAEAGLHVGDVVLGVGRSPFQEAPLDTLAKALMKAESGKGAVTLFVERSGAEKAEKVVVKIPPGGKPLAKPTKGAGRTQLVDKALAWLAARQEGSGGFAETLSGRNGAVVQTALAGLAWLAGGSTQVAGPYKENVAAAARFVIANVGDVGMGSALPGRGGANWDQTNWGYAHAAIFLGELHARAPEKEMRRTLMVCGQALAERQEASGGWAHGPGGPNALGYVELNIVTGLALSGLGLAGQAGYSVPQDVLDRAEAYLQASSSGDGGVGYSSQGGQRGQGNIGRSAGTWLGYETLGLGKSAWGQKMKKWVGRNAGEVFAGHASLMQHFLLAGVAAHALGGKARSAYWDAAETSLTLARAPDGSFQPRPWHETLSMGSNSDVSFGEVWTTAAWTIVLACEPEKGIRPGLPYWMGLQRVPTESR